MNKQLELSIPKEDLSLSTCDLYEKYEFELVEAFGWTEQTVDNYKRRMEEVYSYLNDIPFCECLSEDYDEAIKQADDEYALRKGRSYADSTRKGFRSIINDLCYFVEVYSKGKYKNTLWGYYWKEDGGPPKKTDWEKEKKRRIDKQVKLPRSLSILQEIKLLQEIQADIETNSFCLGVAVMFYMGLRPGECCGVAYGDIRPLEGYPETLCMHIYEQVNAEEMATNELKTANAYRVLPVPTELAELIQRRKKRIEAKVWEDASEYYLVCESETEAGLKRRCQRKHFTRFCQNLLRKIAVDENVLSNLSMEIKLGRVSESSVTSYLLRRNFATALASVCGMEDDELKYEMGHAIYSNDEKRRDYLNPDTLHRLWEKLNRRCFFSEKGTIALSAGNEMLLRQKDAEITVSDAAIGEDGVFLNIWDEFPNDYIKLEVMSGQPDSVEYRTSIEPVPLKRAGRIRIHNEFADAVSQSRHRMKGDGGAP